MKVLKTHKKFAVKTTNDGSVQKQQNAKTNFKVNSKIQKESIVNEKRREKRRAAYIVIYESRDFKSKKFRNNLYTTYETKRALSTQKTITNKTKTKRTTAVIT